MTERLKVGVIGASGRMGSEVCRVVEDDKELDLVARVVRSDPLDKLVEAGAQVAVEFTQPASVAPNVSFCIDNGIHVVVGTTGLTQEEIAGFDSAATEAGVGVFVAPNFALGAVLMMELASRAGRYFDVAEIVERHHEKKLDAPSGTALRTAALMNEARGRPWSAPDAGTESVAGSRGGEAQGIRIHSLRAPGYVAHQEVVLGGRGETLTIRHDSVDRSAFMPGVILAIKSVSETRGVAVGLERLLDL